MKKYIFGFCLVSILGAAGSEAAITTKQRKLSSIEQTLEVTTYFGERTAHFSVKSAAGKYSIALVTNAGVKKQRELTQTDFDFIVAEFKKLSVPPKVPNECYRSKMKIVYSSDSSAETKSSCLGIHTLTEPQYARFATILVNAL